MKLEAQVKAMTWTVICVAVALVVGWYVGRYTDRRAEMDRVLIKLSHCKDESQAGNLLSVIYNWLGYPPLRGQSPEITDAMISDVVLPFLRHESEFVASSAAAIYFIVKDDRVCAIIRQRLRAEPKLMRQFRFLDALRNNGNEEDALFLIQTWKSWPAQNKVFLVLAVYGIGSRHPEECVTWFRRLSESQDVAEAERSVVEEYFRASKDRWAALQAHPNYQKRQSTGPR
jgi:hypothetical protein